MYILQNEIIITTIKTYLKRPVQQQKTYICEIASASIWTPIAGIGKHANLKENHPLASIWQFSSSFMHMYMYIHLVGNKEINVSIQFPSLLCPSYNSMIPFWYQYAKTIWSIDVSCITLLNHFAIVIAYCSTSLSNHFFYIHCCSNRSSLLKVLWLWTSPPTVVSKSIP